MTVSTTSNRINQAGDGTSTVFAFPYKFIQAADIKVYVNNALVATGYTVGTPTDTGANVTFAVAPANGATIVILSDPARTQGTSLPSTGPFPAKTVETMVDKLTLMVQRLADLVGRSFTLSDGDTSAPTTTLPLVSSLKGSVLAFNATTGAPEAGPTIAAVGTVAANSAAINTVAGNITNVNTVAGNNANVTNVGGSISNVNTVATNIAAVNTNATNIAAIQGASANATTATTQAGVATTQAGIATTQAGIATTQATAASASAAAAAAAAASGLYRQVLDKSANYTIVAADQGTLFRANTGSGAITFTLPAISSVTDGFKVSVVKWTSDANVVNINRSGSDTINGGTSVQIGSQYSQVVFVADFETNQWFASLSGLGATNKNVDPFTGNGTTGPFTLSADPGAKANTDVYVGGVHQDHSTYTVSGTSLTFSGAPASGLSIEVVYSTPLPIGTPSDGTVTTAKIADAAVTTAKVVDGAMTTAKHADNSITYAKLATDVQGSIYGFKNRIINGAMAINQRAFGSTPANYDYLTDRFQFRATQSSKFTASQSTTAPAGFINSLLFTSSSAYSVGSTDQFGVRQFIEGLNIADLGWGTANAQPITLSFWVRSSLTGTHSGAFGNNGDSRAYPFSYTISSANTWEQKTITIAGDTSGTWLTTNGIGIKVNFNLGAGSSMLASAGAWTTGEIVGATGSVSVVGTSGATFYITGVQLEKGSTATSFDYRDYGRELALCQRYYEVLGWPSAAGTAAIIGSYSGSPGGSGASWYFKVSKRASPTISFNAASNCTSQVANQDMTNCWNGTVPSYVVIASGSSAAAEL